MQTNPKGGIAGLACETIYLLRRSSSKRSSISSKEVFSGVGKTWVPHLRKVEFYAYREWGVSVHFELSDAGMTITGDGEYTRQSAREIAEHIALALETQYKGYYERGHVGVLDDEQWLELLDRFLAMSSEKLGERFEKL